MEKPNPFENQTQARPNGIGTKTTSDPNTKAWREDGTTAGEDSPMHPQPSHIAQEALGPGIPLHLNRFEIRKVLGNGTFGRVLLGYDPILKREIAIKQPFGLGLAPESLKGFLREALATAGIHHANVCPVYEAGTEDGLPYIVMRFVKGGSLADLLKRQRGPLSPQAACTIAHKLASGLSAAHMEGVIHRDLKPANILYDEAKNEVLIADFGLVQFANQASSGSVKGTPAYMAPEQWSPDKPWPVGSRSDIYSLGIILFEMLTGSVPFTGTVYELMLHHCQTAPPRPSELHAGLDQRLDAICLKAIAKNPPERYQSAQQFALVLTEYLRETVPNASAGALVLNPGLASESIDRDSELAACELHPTTSPETTEIDPENLCCPNCQMGMHVARNRTEAVECQRCGARFSMAAGRETVARLASAQNRRVVSIPGGWSAVLEANRSRPSGVFLAPSDWRPAARGLWQSLLGVLILVVFLLGFIGIAIASGGHPFEQRRYLIASILFVLGQGAGLFLMGLGRRRAAQLPVGVMGATAAWISAFATWFGLLATATAYIIGLTTIAPLPISVALLALLVGEYSFNRYLSSIAAHLGPDFPQTHTKIVRMYLRGAIGCTLLTVLISGVSWAILQNHKVNACLVVLLFIGALCIPIAFVMSVWLSIVAARTVSRHARGGEN